MNRLLAAICATLLVVSVLEARALRDLKQQLASADERARHAALLDLAGRRDEMLRVLTWLDAAGRTGSPPADASGLCRNGALDVQAIGSKVFDLYLLERARGRNEIEARQATLDAIARPSR